MRAYQIEQLRRNDPGTTEIWMHLSQNSDAEWSEALAQNEHVRTIRLAYIVFLATADV